MIKLFKIPKRISFRTRLFLVMIGMLVIAGLLILGTTTIQYESELSIRFKALFSWFDFHFRMEGLYGGGDAGGIGFKGQLIGDNSVNLIFLLHGLARQLEMEAPSDFPSIALRELGISFNTKTPN